MSLSRSRRLVLPLGAIAIIGLALTGCSSTTGSATVGKNDGVVTIEGPLTGKDAQRLEQSWAGWEKANHITIRYTGSANFNENIGGEAQQGNAPDLAIFGQPGLINDLASRGYIRTLPSTVKSTVDATFPTNWVNYTTTAGKDYAAPLLADLNGWVFYSPAQFAKLGLTVPTTWTDLMADSKTIQENVDSQPWCEGFSAGASSGDIGAEWVGDMVLRIDGPAVYDKWVDHKILFNSPDVTRAVAAVGEILQNTSMVNAGFGGVGSINTESTASVAKALESGTCSLSYEPSSFLEELSSKADDSATVSPNGKLWAFILPPVTTGTTPFTESGDFVAAFTDNSQTVKVQKYLASLSWATSRMKLGGAISPANGANATETPSSLLSTSISMMQGTDPKYVRLSAKDLMPSLVGEGTFLTAMVDWMNGKSVSSVLGTVDQSWPKSN